MISPSSPQPLLSVAIITHNEEGNLPRTLRSLPPGAEIVVVDSGSTDRTVAIAQSFGARVLERPWSGFSAQKNFALAQCRGIWILSLDADEELTRELADNIQAILTLPQAAAAYRLKRCNFFLGRWIRHGGFYPDTKLRLFRSTADGSPPPRFSERPVHETINLPHETPTLRGDLLHHAYPTLTGYLEHMNRYSSLGAEVLRARGRTSRSAPAFLANTLLAPLLTFLWNYGFRLGFLDGREGLLLHLYQAVYTSWKYSKAWELHRANTPPPATDT